ncbi:MAG: nitroreductase family protein [Anaerolineae bacterium]|jgi:F420 biosynthesis protein FbiB-like protein|nr:nitroreductase family protein [Anaerolineae bacterium]
MPDGTLDISLHEALFGRRSLRRYHPDPVPQSVIEAVLQAATYAPSAHNRQPWRFVVIQSAEDKSGLAQAMGDRLRRDLTADNAPSEVIEADVSRSYDRMTSAPVLVLLCLTMAEMDVYPDPKRQALEQVMAVQSVAMAGQNLLLAAHGQGLGACWMCAPLFCPDVVSEYLGLPTDWQPQGLVAMGYPAQERTKPRKPLGEVVLWR